MINLNVQSKPAQIYLLTGFFGVGKTTIIRKLLSSSVQKYAIIQNQFAQGEMGIEAPLIIDESGIPFNSFLQLPNGCICCSAKNDLIAAIEYIIANTLVRKIVVQTNGRADPYESIKQFWFDEQALLNAELHSVIAVVSASRWQIDNQKQGFQKQIISANKILISHVDIVGQQKYINIKKYLQKLNVDCDIDRSDRQNIDQFFKGQYIFSKQKLNNLQLSHVNHSNIIRPCFIKGKCIAQNLKQVQQSFAELLWQSKLKIIRIKGVISLQNLNDIIEIQGIQEVFEVKQTKTKKQKYNKQSRILLIGQSLQAQIIRKYLKVIE